MKKQEILHFAVYTYKEVQEILGVKKTTLSKLIGEGKINCIQLGKSYRFIGEQLLKDLNNL